MNQSVETFRGLTRVERQAFWDVNDEIVQRMKKKKG